jgi:hypothetical protein
VAIPITFRTLTLTIAQHSIPGGPAYSFSGKQPDSFPWRPIPKSLYYDRMYADEWPIPKGKAENHPLMKTSKGMFGLSAADTAEIYRAIITGQLCLHKRLTAVDPNKNGMYPEFIFNFSNRVSEDIEANPVILGVDTEEVDRPLKFFADLTYQSCLIPESTPEPLDGKGKAKVKPRELTADPSEDKKDGKKKVEVLIVSPRKHPIPKDAVEYVPSTTPTPTRTPTRTPTKPTTPSTGMVLRSADRSKKRQNREEEADVESADGSNADVDAHPARKKGIFGLYQHN